MHTSFCDVESSSFRLEMNIWVHHAQNNELNDTLSISQNEIALEAKVKIPPSLDELTCHLVQHSETSTETVYKWILDSYESECFGRPTGADLSFY